MAAVKAAAPQPRDEDLLATIILTKAALKRIKNAFNALKDMAEGERIFLRVSEGCIAFISSTTFPVTNLCQSVRLSYPQHEAFMTRYTHREGMVEIDRCKWYNILTDLAEYCDVQFNIRRINLSITVRSKLSNAQRFEPRMIGLHNIALTNRYNGYAISFPTSEEIPLDSKSSR